jgi:hypothetical protein
MSAEQSTEILPRKSYTTPTPEILERFLKLVEATGLVCIPALDVGLSYRTINQLTRRLPEFAAAVEEAKELYADRLEEKALRVADPDRGWLEPVFHKGEEVGQVRRFSERMMELTLKKHRPEYRDKITVDANVRGGVLLVAATASSPEEWRRKFCPPVPAAASPSPETAGSA